MLMKWKKSMEDYLSFTRKDRIGIIVLLLVLLTVIFLPNFFSSDGVSKPATTDSSVIIALKRLEQKQTSDAERQNTDKEYPFIEPNRDQNNSHTPVRGELFYFDPNSIPGEDWKKLGLRVKTISTIQNYLGKGGRFRKPEDLQKVYGLHTDEYKRIAPFIRIETPNTEVKKNFIQNTGSPAKIFSSRYDAIDINRADTTAFISLPGIGSKLATRIVNFRNKLGGFYDISQVGETFGLPDSTFQMIRQYLKSENASIKKININTATIDDLKVHPYIKWSIANPIVAYRTEHGPFANVEDIKKVMAVTNEIYEKIAPYLVAQ